jgi:hypothetical protein
MATYICRVFIGGIVRLLKLHGSYKFIALDQLEHYIFLMPQVSFSICAVLTFSSLSSIMSRRRSRSDRTPDVRISLLSPKTKRRRDEESVKHITFRDYPRGHLSQNVEHTSRSHIEQPDLSEVLGAPDDGENEIMEDEMFYDAPEQQDNVDVASGEATSPSSSAQHQIPGATRKPVRSYIPSCLICV